ncbi:MULTISPECIES: hypothetical protein [Bacillus]|nr:MULTISPECIES: hypothetical protein [Bacillus]
MEIFADGKIILSSDGIEMLMNELKGYLVK